MATSERKARERQAREELILDAARRALVEHGYLALSLDALAAEVEWAKGTIYQHFTSKEDVVLGVAVRDMDRRAGLFERALTLRGSTRERAVALALADVAMDKAAPGHREVEQTVRTRALWERTSAPRRAALGVAEGRCLAAVARVVEEAQAAGDLPARTTPEQLAFDLWAMAHGAYLLAGTSAWAERLGKRLVVTPGQHQEAYLDQLGWTPLSDAHDYRATERRIVRELFAAELGRRA